jgi:uncharacterized protein
MNTFIDAQLIAVKNAITSGDIKSARSILLEFSKDRTPEAFYLLATIGSGDEKIDFIQERIMLLRAAAELGNANAMYDLSVHLDTGDGLAEDKTEALRYLALAAENGHPNAIWQIGEKYLYGVGEYKVDCKKGVAMIVMAANAKSQGAVRTLANFYREGKFGFRIDLAEAERLSELADSDEIVQI